MHETCTHEVLPLSAPIASTCDACGKLMPYVPVSFGEPIVLTENGAYAKSYYDSLFDDVLGLVFRRPSPEALAADSTFDGPDFDGGRD